MPASHSPPAATRTSCRVRRGVPDGAVSLQADVADLLKLHVGVDATLGGVQLTIKVSRRRYWLKVRLDTVARIIGRISRPSTTTPRLRQLAVAAQGRAWI